MSRAWGFLPCDEQYEDRTRCFCWGSADETFFQSQTSYSEHRDMYGVISSLSWMFWSGWTPLPRVSCRSPSGARGVVIALEGSLEILVILVEVWRMAVPVWLPWRRVPDVKKILHLKALIFVGISRSFFQGFLGSYVSNETVPSDRCSPEDMLRVQRCG